MNMTADQLKKWSKDNNKFLKLDDKESVVVYVVSAKQIVKDSFGEEKPVIRWTLRTQEGKEKTFDNGGSVFNSTMADFINRTVKITRKGLQTKTTYEIEEVAWDANA